MKKLLMMIGAAGFLGAFLPYTAQARSMLYYYDFDTVTDGAYELIGTTTFTTEMKIIDGNKYYPKYIVETYSDGVWTKTASGMSESCTLTAGEAPIRLTWQWVKRGFMIIVN